MADGLHICHNASSGYCGRKSDTMTEETQKIKTPLQEFAELHFHTNGHTPKELKRLRRTANACIVDEKTKKRIFRDIPEEFIPANSFEKEYNGTWKHFLGYSLEHELWPLDEGVPEPEENMMPTDMFMALNCAAEVNEFYGQTLPAMAKLKIGIFVGCLIGISIVLFLLVASLMG